MNKLHTQVVVIDGVNCTLYYSVINNDATCLLCNNDEIKVEQRQLRYVLRNDIKVVLTKGPIFEKAETLLEEPRHSFDCFSPFGWARARSYQEFPLVQRNKATFLECDFCKKLAKLVGVDGFLVVRCRMCGDYSFLNTSQQISLRQATIIS